MKRNGAFLLIIVIQSDEMSYCSSPTREKESSGRSDDERGS
jgi:hypothetical protein